MGDNNNNIQSIEGIIQYYINHAFAKSEDNIRTLTSKVDGLTTKFSDLINEEDNRDDTDYFYDESLTAERHAVARTSGGRSNGERKCRFQNSENFTAQSERHPSIMTSCKSQHGAMSSNLKVLHQHEQE